MFVIYAWFTIILVFALIVVVLLDGFSPFQRDSVYDTKSTFTFDFQHGRWLLRVTEWEMGACAPPSRKTISFQLHCPRNFSPSPAPKASFQEYSKGGRRPNVTQGVEEVMLHCPNFQY